MHFFGKKVSKNSDVNKGAPRTKQSKSGGTKGAPRTKQSKSGGTKAKPPTRKRPSGSIGTMKQSPQLRVRPSGSGKKSSQPSQLVSPQMKPSPMRKPSPQVRTKPTQPSKIQVVRKPSPQPKRKEKEPPKEDPIVREGVSFRSNRHRWIVDKLLGQGGFGSVYKVHEEHNPSIHFALKAESALVEKRKGRLKIEAVVLVELRESPERRHFVEVFDRAKTKYKFIVMTLLGPSLNDVRKGMGKGDFSLRSAIHICKESLEAIQHLHAMGWLHRDIKMANFAVGYGAEYDRIYLIDFGCAKKLKKRENKRLTKTEFLGTLDAAPIAALTYKTQCFNDDVESLLYMFFDVFDSTNGNPWRKMGGAKMKVVAESKQMFMKGEWDSVFESKPNVPARMKDVVNYLNIRRPEDGVEHQVLQSLFDDMIAEGGVDLKEPLDWKDLVFSKDGSGKETKKETHAAKEEDKVAKKL